MLQKLFRQQVFAQPLLRIVFIGCIVSGMYIVSGMCVVGDVSAQDVPPTSIRHGSTAVPDSLLELFKTVRPKFIRGFNWGQATRRVNADLHTNVWHVHNPFAGIGSTYSAAAWSDPLLPINQTASDVQLILAPDYNFSREWLASNLPWYHRLGDASVAMGGPRHGLSFGGSDPLALTEGLGFRFQPELNLDTTHFAPLKGDRQGAVFGFRTRRLGVTVSKTPSDPYSEASNDARFHLHADDVQAPVVVLDGSWPDDRFLQWGENASDLQAAPFNGKRMYLAINLRRTDSTDVARDDSVVLRLRITYTTCPDARTDASTETQALETPETNTHVIVFDSLPNPSGMMIKLPRLLDTLALTSEEAVERGYRGQISRLIPDVANELVITRRMIPRAGHLHPDATILAHFTIDTSTPPASTTLSALSAPPSLNPHELRDVYRRGMPCEGVDGGRITGMNVEVVYEGRSDVAIDWVQVGTENLTWLTQGWYDRFADTVYRQTLKHLRAYNKQYADKRLRLYKWFNRDEGGEQYWEGMRYMHMLFDSLTTTERGFGEESARYSHNVLSDLTWQGNMPHPDPRTAAPYYQHGYNPTMKDQRLHLANEWGMKNKELANRFDYDARWGLHRDGTNALPADTTIEYYPGGPKFGSGSWQQRYEAHRYQLMLQPQYLFDTARPWIANPWVFGQWQTDDTGSIPVPTVWRFPTGEEVQLELYSQLILGAKGFMLFWGANRANATHPADYHVNRGGGPMGLAYAPAARRASELQNVTGLKDALSVIDAPLSSPLAGADYLLPNDRTGLYEALNREHPYTVANIARTLGVESDKLYLGFRSTRMAIKEVFDRTVRAEDTLARLQLVTWFSKGFRTWTLGDTSALARILRTDSSGIKTRHPLRPSSEPFDSAFVEVTLLRDSTSQAFVLGVLNRRCNPFAYTDTNLDNFISYAEHDDAMAVQNRSRQRNPKGGMGRYDQQGAREIQLRFNYAHPDGRRRMLHIKSLGEVAGNDRSIVPIDVRIPQDGTLRVLCKPGEGKMLWVEAQEVP